MLFFFFKQKTAYEMRISDWSSDVCSSDLVYGSDAIAGVVNIITKKNERGLTLRARAGLTAQGDGQELTLGATYGTRFADGRGYFLASGTYDRDWGIRAVDREWAVRPVSYGYDFENGINEFEGEIGRAHV